MHLLECRSLEEMKYALKFNVDIAFIVVERLFFPKAYRAFLDVFRRLRLVDIVSGYEYFCTLRLENNFESLRLLNNVVKEMSLCLLLLFYA